MTKLIFLDIDGVLSGLDKNNLWTLLEDKQLLLGKIIAETGAKIVLTSTWRLHTLIETKEYMLMKGFYLFQEVLK